MDYNKLDLETKEKLHEQFSQYSKIIGGDNFFLKMVEEIREQKPNPILNQTGTFHTSKAKIILNKSIYKDTLTLLFDAIRREEKSGDILNGLKPKEYKATMNMIRTLKPVTITFESKGEDNNSFTFNILDTSEEKKTKVTFAFKAIFFYHLDELKKVLFFKRK
jgi:hypothetical protein